MHTHHTNPRRPIRRSSPKTRALVAGAVLTTITGLAAFSTSASADEFYPVPSAALGVTCKGSIGDDAIIMTNSGTDTAHFTIQWNIGNQSGTDMIDVVAGDTQTKDYYPPEGSQSSYGISAPGQPPFTASASTYTDCVPSPIGVITLVCPPDGSTPYLQYTYKNISSKSATFTFGFPDGSTTTATLDANDGEKTDAVPVVEDAQANGSIAADGKTLSSFSQVVNCIPDIPVTTIPATTIPDTTIPDTTVPAPDTTVPAVVVTVPVETSVPPVVEQLPPTVPPTVHTAPLPTTLPVTGKSSAIVIVLASGMLLLGTVLLTLVARRKPRRGSPA